MGKEFKKMSVKSFNLSETQKAYSASCGVVVEMVCEGMNSLSKRCQKALSKRDERIEALEARMRLLEAGPKATPRKRVSNKVK